MVDREEQSVRQAAYEECAALVCETCRGDHRGFLLPASPGYDDREWWHYQDPAMPARYRSSLGGSPFPARRCAAEAIWRALTAEGDDEASKPLAEVWNGVVRTLDGIVSVVSEAPEGRQNED